jgi:hypothetical protein
MSYYEIDFAEIETICNPNKIVCLSYQDKFIVQVTHKTTHLFGDRPVIELTKDDWGDPF